MMNQRQQIVVVTLCVFLGLYNASVEAFSPATTSASRSARRRLATTMMGSRGGDDDDDFTTTATESLTTRRQVLKTAVASATVGSILEGSSLASYAEDDAATATGLTKYQDEACKFSISLPGDWIKSVQELPDRRKITLYIKPDSNQKTLLFMAYTPVRSDYTSLGSFGSADEVAETTILPKSTLAGVQGVESEMLKVESKKQSYFFDYVTEVPSQPKTHFRTIFTLKTMANGVSTLVTITAQTPESEYATMKPLFDKIIDSYEA